MAACGDRHTVLVDERGALWTFGEGAGGRLGTGFQDRFSPTLVAVSAPVALAAAGEGHTAVITDTGDVATCGHGAFGRLGLGDETDRVHLTRLERALFGFARAVLVACGDSHTVVQTEDGCVWTFGWGRDGELGHGDGLNRRVPTLVLPEHFGNKKVVFVAAGAGHSAAASEEGHVFTWGCGLEGRLGHGDEENQLTPRMVAPVHFEDSFVVLIDAGAMHSLAVTREGRLYTWGCGGQGALGSGGTTDMLVPMPVYGAAPRAERGAARRVYLDVLTAAAGVFHTLAVTNNGEILACGNGLHGQLGLGDRKSRLVLTGISLFDESARVVSVSAGYYHSAAITEEGKLLMWGSSVMGQQLLPAFVDVDKRIGRCRKLPCDHALAFAMGTHDRLGQGCDVTSLNCDLVKRVVDACCTSPEVAAGQLEGVARLIGGGMLWTSSGY